MRSHIVFIYRRSMLVKENKKLCLILIHLESHNTSMINL